MSRKRKPSERKWFTLDELEVGKFYVIEDYVGDGSYGIIGFQFKGIVEKRISYTETVRGAGWYFISVIGGLDYKCGYLMSGPVVSQKFREPHEDELPRLEMFKKHFEKYEK